MTWKLIQDTRDRDGWFPPDIEVIRQKLDEGDYVSDLIYNHELATGEKILRIERKASPAELALTLGKNGKVFERELERLAPYQYKVLIFEFTREDVLGFPWNSTMPRYLKKKVRMTGKVIAARLNQIFAEHSPLIIFSSSKEEAMYKAIALIEEVHEEWNLS